MATMTISLPDPMKAWVEEQIAEGEYATSSDYVRDLIRRDREARERSGALRRLIEEAEASGITESSVEEIFAEARALSDERARQRG